MPRFHQTCEVIKILNQRRIYKSSRRSTKGIYESMQRDGAARPQLYVMIAASSTPCMIHVNSMVLNKRMYVAS